MQKFIWLILIFSSLNLSAASYEIAARAEYGFSSFLQHKIKFGENNGFFDYRSDGNQSNLYPYSRYTALLGLFTNHQIEFLYQPIYVSSESTLKSDIGFDDKIFKKGQSIHSTYYFPFYRFLYRYRFLFGTDWQLEVGGGLQIRNATIEFAAPNNDNYFSRLDVGVVPLVALKGRYQFPDSVWLELDATGFWAFLPYLNGGTSSVNGWIYDVGFLAGLPVLKWLSAYLSVRTIGGGAIGSSEKSGQKTYSNDQLLTLNPSLGIEIKLP